MIFLVRLVVLFSPIFSFSADQLPIDEALNRACSPNLVYWNKAECYSRNKRCDLITNEEWKWRCEEDNGLSPDPCGALQANSVQRLKCEFLSKKDPARSVKAFAELLKTVEGAKKLIERFDQNPPVVFSKVHRAEIEKICDSGKFVDYSVDRESGYEVCGKLISPDKTERKSEIAECSSNTFSSHCFWLSVSDSLSVSEMQKNIRSLCRAGNKRACDFIPGEMGSPNSQDVGSCLKEKSLSSCIASASKPFNITPQDEKEATLIVVEAAIAGYPKALDWTLNNYQVGNSWVDHLVEKNISAFQRLCRFELSACALLGKISLRFPDAKPLQPMKALLNRYLDECSVLGCRIPEQFFRMGETSKILAEACFAGKGSACKSGNSTKEFSCEFEKYSGWSQFLKFDSGVNALLSISEKDATSLDPNSEVANGEVMKIGEVTNGPCKGAEILLGHYKSSSDECEYDGKPSPMEFIYGVDFQSDEPPSQEPEIKGIQIGGDCHPSFRMLRLGNRIFSASQYAKSLEPFLKKKFPEISISKSDAVDYEAAAFYKTADTARLGQAAKVPVSVDGNRFNYVRLEKDFPLKSFAEFGGDTNFGKVFTRGNSAYVVRPDHTFQQIDLGLAVSRPNYWFHGYLPEFKLSLGVMESDLVPVAGSAGWFEIKDEKNPAVKKMHVNYIKQVKEVNERLASGEYQSAVAEGPLKLPEYFKRKPLLFYKDLIGRVQVFRKIMQEIPGLAEPLIYLYSDRTLRATVQLCENLQRPKTIPAYSGRWNVEVQASGPILDLDTGRKFKSLFWEGFAGPIPRYKYGWVVPVSGLEGLLNQVLPAHGLNHIETEDFKRYWLPRLSRAPFYRIEILPQEWMDQICPVTISPRPDSFTRVHMRAYELNEPEASEPPLLPTPIKRGRFTAIEWSGILN